MNKRTTKDIVQILEALKPELKERFGVLKIGFFGSFARDEPDNNSDVDILVELKEPLGWDFFDLHDRLEEALDKPVDLATNHSLKKQLREQILKEVRFV